MSDREGAFDGHWRRSGSRIAHLSFMRAAHYLGTYRC